MIAAPRCARDFALGATPLPSGEPAWPEVAPPLQEARPPGPLALPAQPDLVSRGAVVEHVGFRSWMRSLPAGTPTQAVTCALAPGIRGRLRGQTRPRAHRHHRRRSARRPRDHHRFSPAAVGAGRGGVATIDRILCSELVTRIVPFTEARAHLTELLDDVQARHEHVVITRRGRPAAVVVSPEEWEALEEAVEILHDEELLAALRESEKDVEAGRLFSLDEVRRELGLA